jgi:hypothetical protein
MMVAMQRKRMLRPAQLGLLLGLLLLAHLGVMAFSDHGMLVAPMLEELAERPMLGSDEELAATPMACPGGFGDCMLAWRLPTKSELQQALITSPTPTAMSVLLSADFYYSWQLAPYALGPPKRVSPQVLLQVFRI